MDKWKIVRGSGIGLLIASLFLMWLDYMWITFGMLIAVGIIDIVLVVAKKDTISQLIHKLFPQWVDALIMVGLAAYTWKIWGTEGFVPVLMGIIMGHLLWHED